MALYYIHRRTPDIKIEQVMDTLLGFKAEGEIGGNGFSKISPASLRRACAVGLVDAVQSEYSLWSRSPELGMLQVCAELDVAFVPFSLVECGIFAKETPDPATFRDTDFRKDTPWFTEPNLGTISLRLMRSKQYEIWEPIQQVWRLLGACTAAHILFQSRARAVLRI